jgi:hypothetical protein
MTGMAWAFAAASVTRLTNFISPGWPAIQMPEGVSATASSSAALVP